MKVLKLLSLMSVLLMTGCHVAKQPKVPTVGEELKCLTRIEEKASAEVASCYGTYDCHFQIQMDRLINECVWDRIQEVEEVPEPTNIKKYFSGIPKYMIALEDWNYDSYSRTARSDKKAILKRFNRAISLLHKYSKGRLTEFPAEEIMTEVNSMFRTIWMMESECDYSQYMDHLVFRLLQQAVRFCPDITMISDFVSTDGSIAIRDNTLIDYPYQPCYNPVFIRGKDEKWRVYMKDNLLPNRAYKVDTDECSYILLSKHGDMICSRGYDEFDVQIICEDEYAYFPDDFEHNDILDEFRGWVYEPDEPFVLFNPNLFTWKACYKNGESYHQIPGSPVLKLTFDDYPSLELIKE